jgi:hypothetical protein
VRMLHYKSSVVFTAPSLDSPISVTCKSARGGGGGGEGASLAFHQKMWFYVTLLSVYVKICHMNMTKPKV